MEFCSNCNSKLFNTLEGLKCKKCDNYNPDKKKETIKKIVYSENESFPYVKNEYYVQKEIRNRLGLGLMTGINLKKESDMIVVFRNAHILKPNQTNIYLDKYDENTGIYRYVGKGLIGNQNMTAENEYLKNAKQNGYNVHLFWQQNANSDHQYVGKVGVEGIVTEQQPDKNGKIRDVYVFLLKPEM
ncbi:MAG: hypothetical protein IS860_09125 [Nitrosopumilus sp.]|nr:hypothetical protein [Nitrosopumilus sp.]